MSEMLKKAYEQSSAPSLQLGGIIIDNKPLANAPIHLVLKSLTRHGLIAGATGSGKTKTIQVLAERLSLEGIPSLVMDIKGDLSGLAMPSEPNDKLKARIESLGQPYVPRSFPVEFLTLSTNEPTLLVRATLDGLGPLLFSRLIGLNETQAGVVSVLMHFAKEKGVTLIDLSDIKNLLQYAQTETGQSEISRLFGAIATSTIGTILRRVIELEAQGGQALFGQPEFDIHDLLSVDNQGLGIISILRLFDIQDRPKIFSTFMLKLLSDLYREMPELGDADKPKLIIFIDEAHLLFDNASQALLDLLRTMVKLIRSKGIGLFFCTQTPNDIPEDILSQLGLKIQHSLRAFTAKDRKAIKLIAQNFPETHLYNTEQLLTSLGIGEALVTGLDSQGQPTPLVHCQMLPPLSRMGVISTEELTDIAKKSSLKAKYAPKNTPHKEFFSMPQDHQMPKELSQSHPKPQSAEQSSVFADLSKNTLVRQLVRQFFRQITSLIIAMFKTSKKN